MGKSDLVFHTVSNNSWICTGGVFPSSADSGTYISDHPITLTKGRAGQRIGDSITYSLTGW
jgi:hypothetical protein